MPTATHWSTRRRSPSTTTPERDRDERVEEVAEGRLGRVARGDGRDVDDPVDGDEHRGDRRAGEQPRPSQERPDPAEVAHDEQHDDAEEQGPEDAVGEDLPRPGGLERVEVEREEPPEAVCREAEQGAPPDLAVGSGRPARVDDRTRSAASRTRRSVARGHAADGPGVPTGEQGVDVGVGDLTRAGRGDLLAQRVVVGRARARCGRSPSARARGRGCRAARARRPPTGPRRRHVVARRCGPGRPRRAARRRATPVVTHDDGLGGARPPRRRRGAGCGRRPRCGP